MDGEIDNDRLVAEAALALVAARDQAQARGDMDGMLYAASGLMALYGVKNNRPNRIGFLGMTNSEEEQE